MTFQGFDALAGAANNQDMFDILPGGALPGGVDGGAGGYDALAFVGGQYATETAIATGPHSGSVTVDGSTIAYEGLEPVSLAVAPDITLPDSGGNATLTDLAGSSDRLQITDTAGSFETQDFVAPSGSLTINLGSGGKNTLTLSSIDSRFTSALRA